MKLKYSILVTVLLVWETLVFMRVAAERDELREQLAALESRQIETTELPDDQDRRLDTDPAPPSLYASISSEARAWTATEWAEHIQEIMPEDIELKEVAATADYVRLVGEAKTNADIATLMRSIQQADLGSPELEHAMRIDDVSEFSLGVRVKKR